MSSTPLTLWVTTGPDLMRAAPLRHGIPLLVGRDSAADLALSERSVSRRHARLMRLLDGRVRVTDLDSANGTFWDGSAIEEEEVVQPPGLLTVGEVALRLEAVSTQELTRSGATLAQARDPATGWLTTPALRSAMDPDALYEAIRIEVETDPRHDVHEVAVQLTRLALLILPAAALCARPDRRSLAIVLPAAHATPDLGHRIVELAQFHAWEHVLSSGVPTECPATLVLHQLTTPTPGREVQQWLAAGAGGPVEGDDPS